MTQYIDKDALVAEIERLKEKNKSNSKSISEYIKGGIYGFDMALEKTLSVINSFEMEEVDLETAFAASIDHFDEKNNYGQWPESDLRQFAEHFFELGLKTQKG